MKKKYVKPQFYCENFVLTEHVAGNCTVIYNHGNENCTKGEVKPGSGLDNLGFFTEGANSCLLGPAPDDDYCYWNGQSAFIGFSS